MIVSLQSSIKTSKLRLGSSAARATVDACSTRPHAVEPSVTVTVSVLVLYTKLVIGSLHAIDATVLCLVPLFFFNPFNLVFLFPLSLCLLIFLHLLPLPLLLVSLNAWITPNPAPSPLPPLRRVSFDSPRPQRLPQPQLIPHTPHYAVHNNAFQSN